VTDPAGGAIGEEIAFRRKHNRLSQGQLARALGITQGAVSHYEAGRNAPTLGTLVEISAALGCKPSTLLTCLDGILDRKRTTSIRRALAKARGK